MGGGGEKSELLMCKRGNATVNVHLSTLWWGKMQAIFLDRFPFKAGAEAVKIELGRGGEGGGVGAEGWRVEGGGLHLPCSRQFNRN